VGSQIEVTGCMGDGVIISNTLSNQIKFIFRARRFIDKKKDHQLTAKQLKKLNTERSEIIKTY